MDVKRIIRGPWFWIVVAVEPVCALPSDHANKRSTKERTSGLAGGFVR